MEASRGPGGWRCRVCGTAFRPPRVEGPESSARPCPRCGGPVGFESATDRNGPTPTTPTPAPGLVEPAPAGALGLRLRGWGLGMIARVYPVGMAAGSVALLAVGGFAPVLAAWLRDEVESWGDVVEVLGGVRPRAELTDPDADLGPVLARADAPCLFEEVGALARRLGVRAPGQIRLTYLPCCGVVAWGRRGRSRALTIGLPLLDVLNRAELRAVLAHELAHLARGDATTSARSVRFVEALGRALDAPHRQPLGPLRWGARCCHRVSVRWLTPIVLGQETRADRWAASIAGGHAAASALVKVALVQPLFREVLDHYDPVDDEPANLYAFFRAFWSRLPEPILTALRHQLLANPPPPSDTATHPPLLDRLALVQTCRDRAPTPADLEPAVTVLGDLEAFEQMLHNRLFGLPTVEPSVFHQAGT